MSNDNTAKPTSGPCFVDEFCDVDEGHALIAYNPEVGKRSPTRGMIAHFGTTAGATFNNPGQCKANADLACEAFNVHHETGLTPRQLVEQRDELLSALQEIVINDPYKQSAAGKVAAHVIAKVEAKP